MLFTTANFALVYLPLVLCGFFVLGRWTPRGAAAWLFASSLFFYGYWMPVYTLLLLGSIAVNFCIGLGIARELGRGNRPAARVWMIVGIASDLLALAYFKYANFLVDNVNAATGIHWQMAHVLLPIGISFYTFTQIAFLADTYLGRVGEYRPIHYGLFVTYFPHLVAGPVLHHAQMMPQFGDPAIYKPQSRHLSVGLAIFAIGLIKKVVLADGVAPYADVVFNAADTGHLPDMVEAWLAAAAYTFQLYFDFSGYSDMAIGLSLLFNVRLPFNFDSPYRALSISEFWRRWHISLSKFLRDYLYIPLGGNRDGAFRRYVNLSLTMLLGGLWHGASWTFVFWGGLHGAYLMVNHGFRALLPVRVQEAADASRPFQCASWALTMAAVVVAWVFFRAQSFGGAVHLLQSMIGGQRPDVHLLLWNAGIRSGRGALWCAVLSLIAFAMPFNSNHLGSKLKDWVTHRPTLSVPLATFALCCILFLIVLNTVRDSVSAFIYFNF